MGSKNVTRLLKSAHSENVLASALTAYAAHSLFVLSLCQ